MPDPSDPTPVRVIAAGKRFLVVDRNGKRVRGSSAFESRDAAEGLRNQVNSSWKRAKSDRKAKGAPEITTEAALEEWRPMESSEQFASRAFTAPHRFEASKHPRARGGKWVKTYRGGYQAPHPAKPPGSRVRDLTPDEEKRLADKPDMHELVHDDKGNAIVVSSHVKAMLPDKPTRAEIDYAMRMRSTMAARRQRLAEALNELDESVFPHRTRVDLPFDPRLHPRDRVGQFTQAVARLESHGHGAQVALPNGVSVRRRMLGGYTIEGGDGRGPAHLRTAAGAVAEALDRHDRHELGRGGDPDVTHFQRIHEFSEAQRLAMRDSITDVDHISALMRRARKERAARQAPVPGNRHGRSKASRQRYAAMRAAAAHT